MSSADPTWARGQPPPPRESDEAQKKWMYYPPFPLGGKRPKNQNLFLEEYKEFGFAHFPRDFETHLKELADMAMEENWKTKERGVVHEYGLLRNYLRYSFIFIEKEQNDKRQYSLNELWTAYDTRLISKFEKGVHPIYALFEKGKNQGHQWTFRRWCQGWADVRKASYGNFGATAPLPYDPNTCAEAGSLPNTWTHFNPNLEIQYNVEHILEGNFERMRDVVLANEPSYSNFGEKELKNIISDKFDKAMKHAEKKILNPRRVIPQLYFDTKPKGGRFRPNLLLPLHLMAQPAADLALTLALEVDPVLNAEENRTWSSYSARTVLTIEMAYNNARIFDSVESPWLRDTFADSVKADGHAKVNGAESKFVGPLRTSTPTHGRDVSAVCVTPDGCYALTGSSDNSAKLWNLVNGECSLDLPHNNYVTDVCVSPDGQRALTGSCDTTAKFWDLTTGDLLFTLEGHSHVVCAVCFSLDGTRAVTGSKDKTAKIWDLATGDCLFTLEGHGDHVKSVCVVDNARALTGSKDETAKVWCLNTGELLRTLESHCIDSICVTPDGNHVLTASRDRTAKVWNLVDGKCILTLKGHTEWVLDICVTPDGKRALTASGDNTAKVWNLVDGTCILTLEGHTNRVNGVCVTPCGKRAITASRDNTARVWNLEKEIKTTADAIQAVIRANDEEFNGRTW